MGDRAADVLAAARGWPVPFTPAEMARVLNLTGPRSWCPVGPPKPGEKCATVPRASRDRVARVIDGMVRRGQLRVITTIHRHRLYALAGVS